MKGKAQRINVSTHSRPKAAGKWFIHLSRTTLFQHTAARRRLAMVAILITVIFLFQHTAARRRLAFTKTKNVVMNVFQHTAARRRLESDCKQSINNEKVSTHSRPKAAGIDLVNNSVFLTVSTHSRPKAAGNP